MTTRAALNSFRVLRPKLDEPSTNGFEIQTTKSDLEKCIRYASSMISTCVTIHPQPLDHQVLAPTLDLVNCHLDLVHTVCSSICTLACPYPQMSATMDSLQPLVPRPNLTSIFHRYESIGTDLLDFLHNRRLSQCSTLVHYKTRDMLHKHHTHTMVSLQTQPKLAITHQQSTDMCIYQPCIHK